MPEILETEQRGKVLTELPELTSPTDDDYMYIVDTEASAADASKKITMGTLKNVLSSEVTGTASGAVATFIDGGDDKPMKSLVVGVEATQDLHGYSKPWAGGAGKNKLPNTQGNESKNGVTCTKNSDGTYTFTGTASASSYFIVGQVNIPAGTYTLSGCPTGGGSSTYRLYFENPIGVNDTGSGASFTISEQTQCNAVIVIVNGCILPNEGITFEPMVRLSTAPSGFEPYSNICPIVGRSEVNVSVTGKNLWDEEWEVGNINSDGVPISANNSIRSKNFNMIQPNTTYYATCGKTDGGSQNIYYLAVFFYDADKNYIGKQYSNNVTFTTPNNARYFKLATNTSTVVYGNTYNHDITINYPSIDHEYHEYNGQTYTIPLGRTVYGGTLDVTRGILTVTRGNYTNTWNNGVSPADLGDYTRKSFTYVDLSKDETALNTFMNCAKLEGSWGGNNLHFLINTSSHNELYVYLPNDTPNDFQIQLSYELATPQTYTLTPEEVSTILGYNNISADSGDVSVIYVRDLNITINDLINRVTALENE